MVGFRGANGVSPTLLFLFPSKYPYTLLRSASPPRSLLPTTKPPHAHSLVALPQSLQARLHPRSSGTCLARRARDIRTLTKGVFGKTAEPVTASHGKLTVGKETIVAGINAMIAERAYIATYTSQTNTRCLRTLLSRSLTIDSTALPRSKRRDPHRAYHFEGDRTADEAHEQEI